jgi:hypothetical protein
MQSAGECSRGRAPCPIIPTGGSSLHLLLPVILGSPFSRYDINSKYRTHPFLTLSIFGFVDVDFLYPLPIPAMDETDEELVILWFLTGAAVAIMILRLMLRKYRKQGLEIGDYLTIAAIISLLLRGAVIHVALVWGTNSITAAVRAQIQFTSEEIYRREIGSKLTIVNRVFYTV